jgi:tetratricopeptide (TPR) repeat protein
MLAAPLLTWVTAGWTPIYWILVTIRFMNRAERAMAGLLLLVIALSVPLFNITVALYGTSADPAVRTTIAAVEGDYDPDRVVKLQRLVEAHPDDPIYHFLLAGLYKSGRYYEEAFAAYKRVLEIDDGLIQAYVNIGNIFFATGQYSEAISNYRRAIEREPDEFLAWFNLHLAQSESFRFREAEESLARAREIDPRRVTDLLALGAASGERVPARDARLEMASVWQAAVAGRQTLRFADVAGPSGAELTRGLLNPLTPVGLAALAGCFGLAISARRRTPARRCIRCGNPFCGHCKSSVEGHEYCTQCLHLFVKRDGLAPGTKQRKLYEVERHECATRRLRLVAGLLLPGASDVLRGRAFRGVALLLPWFAALVAALPSVTSLVGTSVGLDLVGGLLRAAREVPSIYAAQPLALTALAAAPALWILGNLGRASKREA